MTGYGISKPLAAAIFVVIAGLNVLVIAAGLWLFAVAFTVSTLVVTGTAKEFCAKSGFYAIRPAACLLFPAEKESRR